MQIEHFAARRRILEKANSAGVHQQLCVDLSLHEGV